jgi:hypothetical protein
MTTEKIESIENEALEEMQGDMPFSKSLEVHSLLNSPAVAAKPKRPAKPMRPKGAINYLEKAKADGLLKNISSLKHKTAILIMMDCGLRVSECVSLQLRNFNFKKKVILVKSLKKRGEEVVRQGPISTRLLQCLADYLKQLKPRSDEDYIFPSPSRAGMHMSRKAFSELQFGGISIDSLRRLVNGKPIMVLKVQSVLPISFVKDNQPQASTSISLEQVYNPVLKSSNVDSLDLSMAKEISLANFDMQQENQRQNQYLIERRKAMETFSNVQSGLNSDDLAERERATKEFEAAKRHLESLTPPLDNRPALQVRLNFLRSRLHIKRVQSIDGYIQDINLSGI